MISTIPGNEGKKSRYEKTHNQEKSAKTKYLVSHQKAKAVARSSPARLTPASSSAAFGTTMLPRNKLDTPVGSTPRKVFRDTPSANPKPKRVSSHNSGSPFRARPSAAASQGPKHGTLDSRNLIERLCRLCNFARLRTKRFIGNVAFSTLGVARNNFGLPVFLPSQPASLWRFSR
jgi:hypothetical protein